MTSWLIIPRDPLIFRDGKPFTAAPGSRAKTLEFPYPSTLAGAVRTLAGTDAATGRFNEDRIPELLQKYIRGPILVQLDQQDEVVEWFLPAPKDALLFRTKDEEEAKRYSLAPIQLPTGARSDLPSLELIGFSKVVKDKPHTKAPTFWHWEQYQKWLEAPTDGEIILDQLGITGLTQERRTHVSIDPETWTASPGALFQTAGLEFTRLEREEDAPFDLDQTKKMGIALETDANLDQGLGFLGGERRIVRWRQMQETLPDVPESIENSILERGACRLILVTPAHFASGYLPNWTLPGLDLEIEIVGAITRRYQAISGWDYERNRPKPTRRLTPAGSVYFVKFGKDKSTIQRFIDAVWMKPISDDEQSRQDGFGLAVLGSWDGELRNMEVQS
jgi:CRISPR-associated protein Cmr3